MSMKFDPLELFYAKQKTNALNFDFEGLMGPIIPNLLPPSIDSYLYSLATNPKYSSKIKMKFDLIDRAVNDYGFVLMGRGTNRCIYKHQMDGNIMLKIGFDRAGITDAYKELYNMNYLKPFVTKCFDVSPTGTIGLFERVIPITYKDEFMSVAEDIFDVITKCFIGKYILADIGTKFYMNWGIRKGFGPVLLDYPFMYLLDGRKLHCINQVPSPIGMVMCNGLIDYDEGFNHLKCTKCGKTYFASDLAKENKEGQLEIYGARLGGKMKMSTSEYYINGKKVTEEEVMARYFGDKSNDNYPDNNRVFEAAPPPVPPSYERKRAEAERRMRQQQNNTQQSQPHNNNNRNDRPKETRVEYMYRYAKYSIKHMVKVFGSDFDAYKVAYGLVDLIMNTNNNGQKITRKDISDKAQELAQEALREIVEEGMRASNPNTPTNNPRPTQPNPAQERMQSNVKKTVVEPTQPVAPPPVQPVTSEPEPIEAEVVDDSPTEEDDTEILNEVEQLHANDADQVNDIVDAIDNLSTAVEEGKKIAEANNGISPTTQEGLDRIKQINDMGNNAPHVQKEAVKPAPKPNPPQKIPGTGMAFTF